VKQQNHNGKRKAQADTDGDASSCDGQENGNKRARGEGSAMSHSSSASASSSSSSSALLLLLLLRLPAILRINAELPSPVAYWHCWMVHAPFTMISTFNMMTKESSTHRDLLRYEDEGRQCTHDDGGDGWHSCYRFECHELE